METSILDSHRKSSNNKLKYVGICGVILSMRSDDVCEGETQPFTISGTWSSMSCRGHLVFNPIAVHLFLNMALSELRRDNFGN